MNRRIATLAALCLAAASLPLQADEVGIRRTVVEGSELRQLLSNTRLTVNRVRPTTFYIDFAEGQYRYYRCCHFRYDGPFRIEENMVCFHTYEEFCFIFLRSETTLYFQRAGGGITMTPEAISLWPLDR